MALDRRLDALEQQLSPVQLVLCWLDEALAYPSLTDYVRTLIDLRNADQVAAEPYRAPAGLAVQHLALEEGLADDPRFRDLMASGVDVAALTKALRTLSGVYEQAARAAAFEKG